MAVGQPSSFAGSALALIHRFAGEEVTTGMAHQLTRLVCLFAADLKWRGLSGFATLRGYPKRLRPAH
jgi:hypothetical protein